MGVNADTPPAITTNEHPLIIDDPLIIGFDLINSFAVTLFAKKLSEKDCHISKGLCLLRL